MDKNFDTEIDMDDASARVWVGDWGIGLTVGSEYEGEITVSLDVENTDKLIKALTEARAAYSGS